MAINTAAYIFSTAAVNLAASQVLIGGLVFAGASYLVGKALGLGTMPDFDMSGVGGNIGTTIDPLAASQLVYGEIRKGGVKTYHETTGDNKYYHYFLTLAHHEINGITAIYVNDDVATLDSNGYVTSQSWGSKILIKKFFGADNQNIHDSLTGTANTPAEISNSFKGQGVACLYVRLEYDADVFQNGMPDISAVVQGKAVYDPRKDSTSSSYNSSLGVTTHRVDTASTWQYSSNPALALADYLRDEKGANSSSSEIDYDMIASAADDCASIGASGVTENSFEIGGIINCGETKQNNINNILSTFNGTLFFGQGKFRLIGGAFQTPESGTLFTLDDVRSQISIQTRFSRRDLVNTVKGTFNNKDNRWIADEFPKVQLPDMSEDNAIEAVLDLSMPLVTKPAAAQRLAKQTLFTSREQINLTAMFSSRAYKLQVGDTITLTLPRYGFDEKEFRVNGWKAVGGDGSPIEVELKLQETSSTAYQWSISAEEYQAMLTNNTSLDKSNVGLSISTITVDTPEPKIGVDRSYIGYLSLSWTAPNNSQVTGYDVEYKRNTESRYTAMTVSSNTAILEPLNVGFTYDIQIRAINNRGNKGSYKTASGVVAADTTAPNIPVWKDSSIQSSTVGGFKQVTLEWIRPSARDFSHVEVYFLSGSTYVKLTDAFDETYTHVGLNDATSFSYKLKSVDLAGNISNYSAVKSATTQSALTNGAKGQKGEEPVAAAKGQKGETVTGAKGQKGQEGLTGASNNVIYQRATSKPNPPSASSGIPSGWYDDAANATGGNPLWYSIGTTAVGGTTFTWGDPIQAEGTTTVEVYIYRKRTSGQSAPSQTGSGGISDPPYTAQINLGSGALNLTSFSPSWTTTIPSLTADGDKIYRAVAVASGSINQTVNLSFGNIALFAERTDGTKGQKGEKPPRNVSLRAYAQYIPTNATGTDVPATPSISYVWASGYATFTPNPVVSGSPYSWSLTAPTKIVNSNVNVYFSDFFLETTSTANVFNSTGTVPKQGTSFSGIVSFSSGNFQLDGGAITTIDGGNIVTNSVRTEQIEIDNNLTLTGTTSGILGGRDGISNYAQAGFFFGREARATVGGSSVFKGRQYKILSYGTTSSFASVGAPNEANGSPALVGTVFTMTGTSFSGSGQLIPLGYEVSHSSVNTSNQLEGIVHNEIDGLKIYNADLVSGGDVVSGVQTKTATGFYNLGSGADLGLVTVTVIGGGGGGGFGRDNYTATGSGGTGGTTQARIRVGSQSGTILSTVTSAQFGSGGQSLITSNGGAGGANAPNINLQGGLAGAASTYGAGGASVGQNVVGIDAPSTHYGAGGGGAGGDSQGFFGQDGAGGAGGSAAVVVGGIYNVSAYSSDIYLDITSVGAGGTGGDVSAAGMSGWDGGDGAGGFVEHSAIVGQTVTKQIVDLAITLNGEIGSYAFLFEATNQITPNNTQRAGSTLRYANAISDVNETGWAGYYTVAPTGTWRCMGYTGRALGSATNYSYVAGSRTTLWVRVS